MGKGLSTSLGLVVPEIIPCLIIIFLPLFLVVEGMMEACLVALVIVLLPTFVVFFIPNGRGIMKHSRWLEKNASTIGWMRRMGRALLLRNGSYLRTNDHGIMCTLFGRCCCELL